MKKLIGITLLLAMCGLVHAQQQKQNNKPQEQSKVTREYDEQGNLIRFDSSYVRSWSSDTTFNGMDFEQLQQELDRMFGGGFPGDSAFQFGEPFPGGIDQFFHDFGFEPNDSTHAVPGFRQAFPDLEQMHRQMMMRFQQFFGGDSLQSPFGPPGQMPFLSDPKEFQKFQEELKKEFEQLNDPQQNPPKPKGSASIFN